MNAIPRLPPAPFGPPGPWQPPADAPGGFLPPLPSMGLPGPSFAWQPDQPPPIPTDVIMAPAPWQPERSPPVPPLTAAPPPVAEAVPCDPPAPPVTDPTVTTTESLAALSSQPAANVPPPALRPPPMPEFRSFDGSGNNLAWTSENMAGASLARLGPAHFTDGVSAMDTSGPNPRTISNIVVAGHGDDPNPEGLSGMMYAWGQFIDHDLDLLFSDGTTRIDITIPDGDPVLTASRIGMTRIVTDPTTGVNGKPAAAVNNITGWLDGSMVYGSNATTAASLRDAGGHMLTSAGDNLPIVDGGFLAGDIRVGENPDLTALQVLFVREHNFQVDRLAALHPGWSGDQLYDMARAIVTAEIANITYNEFLPHLLGKEYLPAYAGYNPNVNASISVEFAGAAFRFGHSIVSANLAKVAENGADVGVADSLKDAFFQAPAAFAANGGADGLLRHLAGDVSNALDVHIVDDLRDFLDVPPVAMDLAAINIQRGRDLGLGTLNETRAALHMSLYTDFSQITSDATTAAALRAAYGSVDRVDLWTGGLAEDHINGGMLGETFAFLVGEQFMRLRDGDRLYFENQGFDRATLGAIRQTSLSDIILRNTDTRHIQDDAFVFHARRSGLVGGVASEDADAPQLVIGADGGDVLIGGARDDVLVAGGWTGLTWMAGGAGADRFVMGAPGMTVIVTDFTPGQDQVEFEHLRGAPMRLHAEGGDTLIEVAGAALRLQGVQPWQIQGGDLIFTA
ncbi:MAG: hypothetical protein K2X11_20975 [Acetobacteraceae bacterium]|nr:hypothetical protein [Acetobacteraceae bacterium]